MTLYPLLAMLVLNMFTAVGFMLDKNYGLAIVFSSYAVACAGFIIAGGIK